MARWTIRGYSNQVRLFLFLVVFFLVMQSSLNFSLLFTARDTLAGAARQRAAALTREVAEELPDAEGGLQVPAGHLARLARKLGLEEIAVLSPGGEVRSSSRGLRGGADADLAALPASEQRRFGVGREAIELDLPWRGPGRLVVFRPILEPSSGRVAAILKVRVRPADLAGLTRRIRLSALVQAVGAAAVLLLTFAFIRWMLKPYRLLVRTAGQALPVGTTEDAAVQAPGSLVDAFQGVVDTLNRQEREIEGLRGGAPGTLAGDGPVLSNFPSGVVTTDAAGGVTAVNAAAGRILGLDADAALGRPYADVFGASGDLVRLLDECLAAGARRSRVLIRMRGGEAGPSHLGATVSPLEGGGALCIFSDLTEIRQVEERVRLRENLAEVGQISAGIAHEVRNALATILAAARLALRSPRGQEREHLGAICSEVESIQGILNDYLQFARPLSLNIEPVDLGALTRDLAAALGQEPLGRDVKIEVAGELPEVQADEALLRQALGNLLRNALEACGPGGRVALVGTCPPGAGQVRLEVYDDGPGLPDDADPEDLFRPFFTTKRHGTGLGLPLARKTVVYHDGELYADRGPWGGARFTVTLPRQPAAGAVAGGAAGT